MRLDGNDERRWRCYRADSAGSFEAGGVNSTNISLSPLAMIETVRIAVGRILPRSLDDITFAAYVQSFVNLMAAKLPSLGSRNSKIHFQSRDFSRAICPCSTAGHTKL